MLLQFLRAGAPAAGADAAGPPPGASSRFFGAEPAAAAAVADRRAVAAAALAVELLEELLWDRPWALLLSCILLNQTTRRRVDPVLCRLLREWPDAAAAAAARLPPPLRRSSTRSASTAGAAAQSSPSRRPSWRTAGRRLAICPGVGAYGAAAEPTYARGDQSTISCDHALGLYLRWWRALGRGAPES